MKISDLSPKALKKKLQTSGLCWESGPFHINLKTAIPDFQAYLRLMYGDKPLVAEPRRDIVDFHIRLLMSGGVRRFFRPQVFFQLDGRTHLAPFPLDYAPPMFEWGLNFAIAGRANHFLLLHTAVVAKGDQAMILPGIPGSGKSTLCAALTLRGWRLLSDEFALVRPADSMVFPLVRPIALKNQSIELIREFDKRAVLGPEFPKTRKGCVAHLKPLQQSVQQMSRPAKPTWVICPNYQEGRSPLLEQIPKEHAFLRIAANAFNYETLGADSFIAVSKIVRNCQIYNFRYSNLEEAVTILEQHVAEDLPVTGDGQ